MENHKKIKDPEEEDDFTDSAAKLTLLIMGGIGVGLNVISVFAFAKWYPILFILSLILLIVGIVFHQLK